MAPKEIKENGLIKILSNSDTQLNPKTINSIMVKPEWSSKPRQIYEAQRIKTLERIMEKQQEGIYPEKRIRSI